MSLSLFIPSMFDLDHFDPHNFVYISFHFYILVVEQYQIWRLDCPGEVVGGWVILPAVCSGLHITYIIS